MSVVVVHRDGWAACDSRTSLGETGVMPISSNKAFVASGWLTAVVGNGAMNSRLKLIQSQHFESEVIQNISESLQEKEAEGHALLVNRTRNLMHIDQEGAVDEIDLDHEYFSIGCASSFVMGYLSRISQTENRPIRPEDAKNAIISASKYDCGIDDKVKVFYLNA